MTTMGDRLRMLRLEQGRTQQFVADLARVSKQAISKIERTGVVKSSAETIQPIADHYGVNMRWLLTGRGPKFRSDGDTAQQSAWVYVPVEGSDVVPSVRGKADKPSTLSALPFAAQLLRGKSLDPTNLRIAYVRENVMSPALQDGDVVLFDTSDRDCKDDKLFVVAGQLGPVPRRITLHDERWYIACDNRRDPKWRKPVALNESKGSGILGRICWFGHWMD